MSFGITTIDIVVGEKGLGKGNEFRFGQAEF